MAYKVGANVSDQVKIQEMAKAGKSAKEISEALKIKESVVKAFMPKPKTALKK